MDLNTVWFVLIAVLFIGFFFLEGFDYGVGILLPFLGRDEADRRVIVSTIGPFWDGNEVWMITAGGAMFAAFPHWYATLFSGFYLALVLMLLALIVRGVAFEFRGKDVRAGWRKAWDALIFVGSLVPAVLWGVAVANLVKGVPIDASMTYVGGFWNLLNPFALLGGAATLLLFTLHGAVFLVLKTKDEVRERARRAARALWVPTMVVASLFSGMGYVVAHTVPRFGAAAMVVPVGAAVCLALSGWFIAQRREGWAFGMTGLGILLSTVTIFLSLYPRVMVSSLNPEWSLTIYNASSSPYTLKVMTIVALIFVPIVLIYQGWTYYIFRERVGHDTQLEY